MRLSPLVRILFAMALHPHDKRQMRAVPDPATRAFLVAQQESWFDQQIALARAFAVYDEKGSYAYEGCGSIVQFGMRLGYSVAQVRHLASVGKALAMFADLEERVRDGEITLDKAASMGRLHRVRLTPEEKGEWMTRARMKGLGNMYAEVKKRLEQEDSANDGCPVPGVIDKAILMREKTAEKLERCGEIASQKAGKRLTEGGVVDAVCEDYLEHHDEQRKKPRARRVGDTNDRPDSRYIPAEVRLRIKDRSGNRCEFPNCDFGPPLEFVHLKPHALGSGREVEDLADGCRRHHTQYDAGVWTHKGFDDDGKPVFELAEEFVRIAKGLDPPPDKVREPPLRWNRRYYRPDAPYRPKTKRVFHRRA